MPDCVQWITVPVIITLSLTKKNFKSLNVCFHQHHLHSSLDFVYLNLTLYEKLRSKHVHWVYLKSGINNHLKGFYKFSELLWTSKCILTKCSSRNLSDPLVISWVDFNVNCKFLCLFLDTVRQRQKGSGWTHYFHLLKVYYSWLSEILRWW